MTAETRPVDVSGRPVELRPVDWERLFAPKTAVFIGATDREGTQQRAQWLFLKERLEPSGCRMIPIHPTRPDVLGVPTVPSVLDVDGEIDVAVILVRDPLPALEECVAKGVGFVIVFSAGFSELGTPEGHAAEARVAELASGATRVIGPNTNLNIFEPWRQDLPGRKLAIVTQSGFQGRPISQGQSYGIAIESWATLGNEADVEWADLVGHYVGRPSVGAVATYVEGFQDGRTMLLAADRAAAAGVPIVAIKVGRSAEGQAMAQAHTGHLAGSDAVHDAAFRQSGIVRVDDIDEVIEISGAFCHSPPLTGSDGVALYTLSGGTAAHLVDLLGAAGVPVPRFEDRTIERLAEYVPAILRMDNPLDSGGTLTVTPAGRTTLEIVLEDANTNVLIVPVTGVFPGMIEPLARDLVELHREGRQPILVVWATPVRDNDGYRLLCEHGVPLFHSFGAAVRGVAAMFEHRRFLRSYASPFAPSVAPVAEPATVTRVADARQIVAGRVGVDEVEAKQILRSYGITTVDEVVISAPEEAADAVAGLGGRAVLKVLSADIAHKSDLGLVSIGIDADRAGAETSRLLDLAAARAPGHSVRGVVAQRLVDDAVAEAIIGISHSPPFGPVVMFGLGGVFVEVFEDVTFGVPPFGEQWARTMVESTKSFPLLAGARGRERGDIDALVETILAVQRLAMELGDDIAELDINPLMVRPAGLGVVAVDALLVPRVHSEHQS